MQLGIGNELNQTEQKREERRDIVCSGKQSGRCHGLRGPSVLAAPLQILNYSSPHSHCILNLMA